MWHLCRDIKVLGVFGAGAPVPRCPAQPKHDEAHAFLRSKGGGQKRLLILMLTFEWHTHTHTQILQFAEIVTGSHFPSERYSSIQGFELYGASSSFSLCVGTLAVEMTML